MFLPLHYCPALHVSESASHGAELFWVWAIWLSISVISLWNPNEFGPLVGAGHQQKAIQLTVVAAVQDRHFKASHCLSASSNTMFTVTLEWQSKT